MGCCGCSLYTSAIVAAVFGILESFGGLTAALILFINGGDVNSPYSLTLTASESEISASIHTTYYDFIGAIISGIVVNGIWALASILLIVGIIKENACLHKLWVAVTSIVMICDAAQTIAIILIYVRQNDHANIDNYTPFMVLFTFVNHGSLILWIINICLTIYTARRAVEINQPSHLATHVFIQSGGQPMQALSIPGQQQIIFHHSGSSTAAQNSFLYQPLGEFENQCYRPDLPNNVQGGLHPDQKC